MASSKQVAVRNHNNRKRGWRMKAVIMALALVIGGKTDYQIVVSGDASGTERWAAEELAGHIKEMSGAELSIVTEGAQLPPKAILIGDSALVKQLGVAIDHEKLGTDGFVIKSAGNHLVIAGGRRRGTMYGVYGLLSQLGCRWWAPGESTIPRMADIRLEAFDIEKVPALEYRDMLYGDLWQGKRDSDDPASRALWLEGRKWCARNHIHAAYHEMPGDREEDALNFGPIRMDRAIAHGMIKYLSADKYLADHPEWYALRNGKRVTDHVCLANEEAAGEMAKNVIAELDKHPEWRLITLGQADNNNFCTCEKCAALVEKHKANSGMMVYFINRVARIVKTKHPKVFINTNAYRWSQAAPEGIRCDDNVMITIPPIACNYSEPLENGWPQENADYRRDLATWGKLTSKIYVWDYTVNFVHYAQPWPNVHVIAPNIRYFIENNVRGIFNQGSHTTDNGSMSKLVMWVLAHTMWNPEADSMKLAGEFCLGYYGPEAGPLVLEYVNLLVDKVVKDKIAIWATHRTHLSSPHLTPEIIAKAEALFRKAESLVADDAGLLKRVETAHFPVLYMLVRRPDAFWAETQKQNPALAWPGVCKDFSRIGRAAGITRVAEGDHAVELFEWADDMAERPGQFPGNGMPAEVRNLEPEKVTFIQAAQFDKQVKFLTRAEGASDGWAQRVLTHGWSITDNLLPPRDCTVGKTYRVYVRVMGKANEGAWGAAMLCGIHHPDRKRVSTSMDAALMDGTWQTVEVGTWEATEVGGSFYMAWHPNATKTSMFRPGNGPDGKPLPPESYIDCLWLVEQGE